MGVADVIRAGTSRKEIYVTPSGLQNGLEDVLIIVDGVHAQIPEAAAAESSRASAVIRRLRIRPIRRIACRPEADLWAPMRTAWWNTTATWVRRKNMRMETGARPRPTTT